MSKASITRLPCDDRGAAAVEFSLIAPVFLLTIMGIFDLAYNMYTVSLLDGSIQKAARDSTIEAADLNEAKLDARISAVVHRLAPNATLEFDRTSYSNFTDVREPEDYDDVNADGACNDGEPFEDANGNGAWDADRGSEGFGSAKDAILYEVTVTFERPFPFWKLANFWKNAEQTSTFTMVSKTILRNQPYSLQEARNAIGNCA